jgi:hypothetical protein
MLHEVPWQDQIAPQLVAAAQNDVGVGIVRVPMIDRQPGERLAQRGLGAGHHVAGVARQVFQRAALLGGEDDAEMALVAVSPIGGDGAAVDAVFGGGVEKVATGCAIAREVIRMAR